jgi:serine/threonine protein kinase
MAVTGEHDLGGSDRFVVQRRLGQGGFGVVYQAYDKKREQMVAVKTLRRMEAAALYRFKKEFRILADIVHPNLVTLHDLLSERDVWFFSMELVEGVNLLEYLRERMSTPGPETSGEWLTTPAVEMVAVQRELPTLDFAEAAAPGADQETLEHIVAAPSAIRLDRLRDSFRQLADALCTLHETGILHRDIKPSNVLVAPGGRVVLLDFGLAMEIGPEEMAQSMNIVGTPAYLAPEQAAGKQVSEASDWYAVGVMMYEALAGRVPFSGSVLDVLNAKQRQDPLPLKSIVAGVPEDLSNLCQELLRRLPDSRPGGRRVLDRLGGPAARGYRESQSTAASPRDRLFVGREAFLKSLFEAFESAKQGRAVTVHIQGRSGIGKSALARRFFKELRQREPSVVLVAGRCYQQEMVPYKGVDSLIDDLSKFLQRLPDGEAEKYMPRDVSALARLFPVLRQVEAIANARGRMPDIVDPQELRRRAFTALRELLARLADRMPVVLFLDDMHWGDLDSAALLAEVMRPPDPPALMLVLCYRDEGADANPVLQKMRPSVASPGEVRELAIRELDEREANEMVTALLERNSGLSEGQAEIIARESGGHPMFLDELVRHAGMTKSGQGTVMAQGASTLDNMIQDRVLTLPDPAHRLLEVVAVAGRPVRLEVAVRAAGLAGEGHEVLRILHGAHLMRTRRVVETVEIELYHDRIRETVASRLDHDTQKSHHRSLALALQDFQEDEPEALAVHFREAGDPEQASNYAVTAADRAAEALAFDHAARLYKFAAELQPPGSPPSIPLYTKWGDSLANAGRGAEAARTYLTAAEHAMPGQVLDLERRAAEQFLISGHVDEGLEVLRRVLGLVGMKLSKTPRHALLSLLARRAWIRIRGLGFRERKESEIPAEALRRVDTSWAVAIGLGMSEVIQGAEFQARHLLLALRSGELNRVARAIAVEVGFSSQRGTHSRKRTEEVIRKSIALSERANQPYVRGLSLLNQGIAQFLWGNYRNGKELCDQAQAILREQCTGVTWELDTAQLFAMFCILWMGEWGEMRDRYELYRKQAEDRGDLYLLAWLRPRISHLVMLAADDPKGAEEEERIGRSAWPRRHFDLLRWEDTFVQTDILLYNNRPLEAWEFLSGQWAAISKSLVLRIQVVAVEAQMLRARSLLALLGAGELPPNLGFNRKQAFAMVETCARKLVNEKSRWTDSLALHFRACLAATGGEHQSALDLATQTEQGFRAVEMAPYALAIRRRRGELIGGEEGAALIQSADAEFLRLTVKNPARVTAWLAPGKWPRG